MVMNYLMELKAFYDKLELNPLPSQAIALWHTLMHIANKTCWQEEFTVAVSVLMLKSGLNAQAVKRARNRLAQDGYIDWKPRGGNLSASYHMNSLVVQNDSKNVPQIEPQYEPQDEPQVVPQSEPINKHKQNKTNKNIMCKADADALFEKLWKPYPCKKGKGQVSDAAKMRLLKIGYEEMVRAIERYKDYLDKNSDWLKPQHGSTFFSGGYVDYLDANYVPEKVQNRKGQYSQFNQFPQNDYDFEQLEKEILSN